MLTRDSGAIDPRAPRASLPPGAVPPPLPDVERPGPPRPAFPSRPAGTVAPGATGAGGSAEFVVVFHPREAALPAPECAALARWLQPWLQAQRECGSIGIVVGCCADTSRHDRQQRLAALVRQLVDSGVDARAIRITADWAAPCWERDGPALPFDLAWLKAVDVDAAPTQPDTAIGVSGRGGPASARPDTDTGAHRPQERACTNAS